MSCPGCGHSLTFDFAKGRPACGHCNYPAPPDDLQIYTKKEKTNEEAQKDSDKSAESK